MAEVEELTDPIVDAIEKVAVEQQTTLTIAGVAVLAAAVIGIGATGYFIGNKIKSWNEGRRSKKTVTVITAPPKE
jgi:hypothetical protein